MHAKKRIKKPYISKEKIITDVKPSNNNNVVKYWGSSQAEYDTLQTELDTLNKNKKVITCLADMLPQIDYTIEGTNKLGVLTQIKKTGTIVHDADFAPLYDNYTDTNSLDAYLQTTNALLLNSPFLGYGELSLLNENGFISNIINGFADDIMRKNFDIISSEKILDVELEEQKNEKIKLIKKEFERLKCNEVIHSAVQQALLFGGSMIFVKIKGDNIDNNFEDELILDKDLFIKGSLVRFQNLEPRVCYPRNWNAYDPTEENYYNPDRWLINGQKLYHKSRLMKTIYQKASQLYAPIVNFFGYSLTQFLVPFLNNYFLTLNNVVGLVTIMNTTIIKADMTDLITMDQSLGIINSAGLKQRIKDIKVKRDNDTILVLDNGDTASSGRSKEDFEQYQINLSGLDQILVNQQQNIAAIAMRPLTKIFGISPAGMNATGESDSRNDHERLTSLREQMVKPNLKYMLDIIQMNLFGEIDQDLIIQFEDFYELNAIEKSTIQTNKITNYCNLVSNEIFSKEEAFKQISNDKDLNMVDLDADENFQGNFAETKPDMFSY